MLRPLAELASRRPRAILGAALAVAILTAAFGSSTPSHLSSSDDDFQDKSSESFRTERLLSAATGIVPGPSFLVVGTHAQARRAERILRSDRAIALVEHEPSRDGKLVLVSAFLRNGAHQGATARRLVRTLPGVVGGAAVA